MAQHKNAKPKPKGWLMAIVDSIYKEGAWCSSIKCTLDAVRVRVLSVQQQAWLASSVSEAAVPHSLVL
jgi:hypothetical protein